MVNAVTEIVEVNCLTDSHRSKAVELVRFGFEDFYQLFDAEHERLNQAIGRQFSNKTELSDGLATSASGQLTGIACAYPRDEMSERQAAAVKLLLEVASNRPSTLLALRKFSENFAAPAPNGLYVSRVGVLPQHRGQGTAGLLLGKLEQKALLNGQPHIQLHVRCDNRAGRCFYAAHGYVERSSSPNTSPHHYLLLYKKL